MHEGFDSFGGFGEGAGEAVEGAVGFDVENIFDADSDFFFRDINAGLDGEEHAFVDGFRVVPVVADVDADQMADAVDEVFAQRLSMEVFAVGVHGVEGGGVEGVGVAAVRGVDAGLAGNEGFDGGGLGSEDDAVNFALTGGEVAVDGHGARDVGGVHRVFAGGIDEEDIAGLHGAAVFGVMKDGGV